MNKDSIEKIANLAKVKLSEVEKKQLAADFPSILNFIDQLSEVDLSLSSDSVNSLNKTNQLREDIAEAWEKDSLDIAIKQANDIEDSQFKVKRVL